MMRPDRRNTHTSVTQPILSSREIVDKGGESRNSGPLPTDCRSGFGESRGIGRSERTVWRRQGSSSIGILRFSRIRKESDPRRSRAVRIQSAAAKRLVERGGGTIKLGVGAKEPETPDLHESKLGKPQRNRSMKKYTMIAIVLLIPSMGMELTCREANFAFFDAVVCLPDGGCSTDPDDLTGAAFDAQSCDECADTEVSCCNSFSGECRTLTLGDCVAFTGHFVVVSCDECTATNEN